MTTVKDMAKNLARDDSLQNCLENARKLSSQPLLGTCSINDDISLQIAVHDARELGYKWILTDVERHD